MKRIIDTLLSCIIIASLGFMGGTAFCEFMNLRSRVEALEQRLEGFEIIWELPGEPTPAPPEIPICPRPATKSC